MSNIFLTSESNICVNFIEKHINKKNQVTREERDCLKKFVELMDRIRDKTRDETKTDKFETTHKSKIKKIHNDDQMPLMKMLEESDSPDIENLIKNPPKNRKKLHELLYNGDFVTLDIHQEVETQEWNYFILEHKHATIHLYTQPEILINYNLIDFILCFMYQFAIYNKTKFTNKPIITIVPTEIKKKLTESEFLTAEHINSGACMIGKEIYLWRHEELYKVLIHELIHFYGFDYNLIDKIDDNPVHPLLCFEGEDSINESYTETLAILIHSYLVSIYTGMDFYHILNTETNFVIFQITKILKFFNIENITDIINKNSCQVNIKQKSNVVSYFLLKGANLLNLDKFIPFVLSGAIMSDEKSNGYLDELKKSITVPESFSNYVHEIYQDSENLENTPENYFILNTMRMSCFSLN